MAKVKITQIRSIIGRPQSQKDTMRALGLRKMNQSKEVEVNPMTKGMIDKIAHLITIEEL